MHSQEGAAGKEKMMKTPQDKQDFCSVETFTPSDLLRLRSELLQPGIDSFQAAEIVSNFLSGHGYGVSPQEARGVVGRIDSPGMTAEGIQAELASVARVM